MLVGPVFTREVVVAPRRPRIYVLRTVYGAALLLLISTAWMILNGPQIIRNVSDMARFGTVLFQIVAPLQLALLTFLAAVQTASGVTVEKDRQTLILLLITRLTNAELVFGKLLASMLSVVSMLLVGFPIMMLIILFGGSSFYQVWWAFAVTLVTCFAAGCVGTTIAFWREKTFQTLALVVLVLVAWMGFAEAIAWLDWQGWGPTLSAALSPWQAILAVSQADIVETASSRVVPYLVTTAAISACLIGVAVARVRYWNPSRDIRPGPAEYSDAVDGPSATLTIEGKLAGDQRRQTSTGRHGHIDDQPRRASSKSREVWDNPVLWREMCTWAYGKKIVLVRLVYWLAGFAVASGLWWLTETGATTRVTADVGVTVPVVAQLLAPFMLVSLVMINALAVSSITSERDGQSLELLRVTDLSPKEFLFGKMLGVMYVALDMILWPLVLCGYVWWTRGMTLENFVFLLIGQSVLVIFVTALGVHCGLSHSTSRAAIGVSLGTVFFLFLGVITSMVMMVSFTGNVEAQLTPFLACIVGGAVGLYIALGWHIHSTALFLAAMLLPFAMFYTITSLLLKNYTPAVIVVSFSYGFATTAMLMPRLSEFLVASGRVKSTDDG